MIAPDDGERDNLGEACPGQPLSRSVRLLEGTVPRKGRSGAVLRVSQGNGDCHAASGSDAGQAGGCA
jgi:hypothetical protein